MTDKKMACQMCFWGHHSSHVEQWSDDCAAGSLWEYAAQVLVGWAAVQGWHKQMDDFLRVFFCAITTYIQLEADDSIENLLESGHAGSGGHTISMSGLTHMWECLFVQMFSALTILFPCNPREILKLYFVTNSLGIFLCASWCALTFDSLHFVANALLHS